MSLSVIICTRDYINKFNTAYTNFEHQLCVTLVQHNCRIQVTFYEWNVW